MWKHPDNIPSNFQYISNNIIKSYIQWGLCAYSINKNLCEKLLAIDYIDKEIDNYLYQTIFPDYNIVMSAKDPFINNGYLAGYKSREYQFESIIW